MKGLKINKKYSLTVRFLVFLLLLAVISFVCCKLSKNGGSEVIEIDIPAYENQAFIDSPMLIGRVDTVYVDSGGVKLIKEIIEVENPVNVVLLALYEEAVRQNDSLKQLNLYRMAITEREYIETLSDSIQDITVRSKVTGTLSSQEIRYSIKPRKIAVKVPKLKRSFYAGAYTYMPIGYREAPVVGFSAQLVNKKHSKIYTAGFDTQKRVMFGLTLNLF